MWDYMKACSRPCALLHLHPNSSSACHHHDQPSTPASAPWLHPQPHPPPHRTPDGHSVSHISIDSSGKLALCAAGKTVHLLDLAAEDKEAARKVYPPVPGGVVECTSFVRSDKLLVSYYGGITLWGTDPAEDGIELEYGSAVHAGGHLVLQ